MTKITTEEQSRRIWDELLDVAERLRDELQLYESGRVEFMRHIGVDSLADLPELLASLRRQCTWQPIETAPPSTKVDILLNGKTRIPDCTLSHDEHDCLWWIDELDKEVIIDWDIDEVTHWMPIAALPVKAP